MDNKVITYRGSSERNIKNVANTDTSNISGNRINKKKNLLIGLSIAVPILIGGLIALIIFLVRGQGGDKNYQEGDIPIESNKTNDAPAPPQISPKNEKIEKKRKKTFRNAKRI